MVAEGIRVKLEPGNATVELLRHVGGGEVSQEEIADQIAFVAGVLNHLANQLGWQLVAVLESSRVVFSGNPPDVAEVVIQRRPPGFVLLIAIETTLRIERVFSLARFCVQVDGIAGG